MVDRLTQLLQENECLYGLVCRDTTSVDVELMAQLGYHVVWLDLEHSLITASRAAELSRSITHQGMVPLVRIPELSRTNVQVLLDEGVQILTLPDIRNAEQVRAFVTLGKYPPLGRRGVSSTTIGTGFTLGKDTQKTLSDVNDATRLMVMIESDEAYDCLDDILAVEGLDMISIGPQDWSTSAGVFGAEAAAYIGPKIERVIKRSFEAGKIVVSVASDPEQGRHYQNLGARVLLLGVDVAIKRAALGDRIGQFQK